jgi:hypothetical protein
MRLRPVGSKNCAAPHIPTPDHAYVKWRPLHGRTSERWKRRTGAAGTVVLCDTGKVFHHESLPTKRDRAFIMSG